MRQPKRLVTRVAGTALVIAPAAVLAVGSGTAAADGPTASNPQGATAVTLSTILRRCDFSNDTHVPGRGTGQAFAVISKPGSNTVSAEVHLHDQPDTHYNVRLILVPRASSARCGPGEPGVALGFLDTDWAGNATTTVQQGVLPGATGAWVFIEGPEGGNTPVLTGDFYTSDFVAAI